MNKFDIPIAQLSFTEKLDLMEVLWADMAVSEQHLNAPAWHETILNERDAAWRAGQLTVSDWEEAKQKIKLSLR